MVTPASTLLADTIDLGDMWDHAIRYTMKRYGGNVRVNRFTRREDLISVAGESFSESLVAFPKWCADHRADQAPGLFWTFTKKRIDWDLLKYLERRTRADVTAIDDNEEREDAQWVRTQLTMHVAHSELHRELADIITTMTTRDRVIFALVCFEELPFGHIQQLFDTHTHAVVSAQIKKASLRFQYHAINRILSTKVERNKPKWIPTYETPAPLARWTQSTYGVDLDTYLTYVDVHFRADVSYLIEILERSHGTTRYYRGNIGNDGRGGGEYMKRQAERNAA